MLIGSLFAWCMILLLYKSFRAEALNRAAGSGINAVFKGNSLDSGLGTGGSGLAAAHAGSGNDGEAADASGNVYSSYKIDVVDERGKLTGRNGRDNWVHLEAELP